MEPEIGLRADLQRQERSLREREIRSNGLVIRVRRAEWHDQIVGVVSTEKENADEGFVVGSALRESADEAEFAEAADERSGCRRAASQPQEVSTRVWRCHFLFLLAVSDSLPYR